MIQQQKNQDLQTQIESIQSNDKQTHSHFATTVTSLTAELEQLKKSTAAKLETANTERTKAIKEAVTANRISKEGFFIGAFLGLIGAFISWNNGRKLSSQVPNSEPESMFGDKVLKLSKNVNPFDLSVGLPFS